jgi:DNA ligase-associated metallophosphoesterase
MSAQTLDLCGAALSARPSGALFWPAEHLLVVSDLHLGRSERIARLGGRLLPPYEVEDTLLRLDAEIAALSPRLVICLGDSFDDLAAADLPEPARLWLARLMAGRRWIWITGNHDPAPVALGGEHRAGFQLGALTFRHIAEPQATAEISGHYHPKLRLAGQLCPCFLVDATRLIMPAFGTYTGGMNAQSPVIAQLFGPGAIAVLTGKTARAIPFRR